MELGDEEEDGGRMEGNGGIGERARKVIGGGGKKMRKRREERRGRGERETEATT